MVHPFSVLISFVSIAMLCFRRRRARERQQRVMADFANKQKEFMEKNMGSATGEMDLSDSTEDEPPTAAAADPMFDCVICNQQTTTTQDRPIGLVALLQPSSGM